jgi:hypothetical protein
MREQLLCQSALRSLRKKAFGRHSERSEESLLIQNKGLREILRAKSALRMTVFRLFPQTVMAISARYCPQCLSRHLKIPGDTANLRYSVWF